MRRRRFVGSIDERCSLWRCNDNRPWGRRNGRCIPAHIRMAIGGGGVSVTQRQWYNIDLAAGTTYPYAVLIVTRDSVGTITGVTLSPHDR